MRWISWILGVLLVCSACGKVEVLGKGGRASLTGGTGYAGSKGIDTGESVTYVLVFANTADVDVRNVLVKVSGKEIRVDGIDDQRMWHTVVGVCYTGFDYVFELWSGDVYLGKAAGSLPYRVIEDGDVYTFDINPSADVDFVLGTGLRAIGFNPSVDGWVDESSDIRG